MTVKQGVNQANSITFSITDEENNKIYLEALAQAADAATPVLNRVFGDGHSLQQNRQPSAGRIMIIYSNY